MGQTDSSPNYGSEALWFYQNALSKSCLLPDIGIDESLLKYSGLNSNTVLKDYSIEMLKVAPSYVSKVASALGPLTSVPNAIGIGALVISMIIEIFVNSNTQKIDNTYSLLLRVFGEEKASSVRDTMSEYLRRHRMYINNDQQLREEISRLEKQLSNDLTILRNSLLHDGQMRSRGMKIWVNGAAFYVQMLIHEARLNIEIGEPASKYRNAIEAAISIYLQDLEKLLEKYKTYMVDYNIFLFRKEYHMPVYMTAGIYSPSACFMKNKDAKDCELEFEKYQYDCSDKKMMEAFMDIVYSNYEPIKVLKSYFEDITKNLNSLIRQSGSFTLPSAAG